MTWLVEEQPSQQNLAEQFRGEMKANTILQIPGAHDGMAALIAKKNGFKALYLSGAAYTASRGLPDLGVVYSQEVAERAREIVRASGLPLLVDIDTGFGGILHVARTAKEMMEAKVAAVQMEDQEMPKKCGHLNGKKLISSEEMVQKIRMLKEVAPSLILIARTDAKSIEGIEAAINRAKQYETAGADAIFPEALTSQSEFIQFRQGISVPLLANMTEFGKTPYYTNEQFQAWGYDMVIYPVTSMRVAAKAYEMAFKEIRHHGTQKNILKHMQTRQELYETIRYYDYEDLDDKIAKTVLKEHEDVHNVD